MMYFSGQIGINPETGELEDRITRQTQRACENIKLIATEAGIDMSDIVKTTIFLTDMDDYAVVNEIYGEYFPHRPARSCVAVAKLPAGAVVEIEVIAHKQK